MNNIEYGNSIDTLDKLLGVNNENPSKVDYYKLWLKVVLEQKNSDNYKEDLESIDNGLKSLCESFSGNNIEAYIMCHFLRHICLREIFCLGETNKWREAFDVLKETTGFLEYSKIDFSYLCYLFGRLFYDIQEYYSDYLSIKKQISISCNTDDRHFVSPYDYARIEEFLKALFPHEEKSIIDLGFGTKKEKSNVIAHLYELLDDNNIQYKKEDIETFIKVATQRKKRNLYIEGLTYENETTNPSVSLLKFLNLANFFFNKALETENKEHYYAWQALTCQKMGIILFYSQRFNESIDKLKLAINYYEKAMILANKVITNLFFNTGLCHFYLEMIYLYIEKIKDGEKAKQSFNSSCFYFSKSLSCHDESQVKSEYTFRRGELDVYYYRLIAYHEYVNSLMDGSISESKNIVEQIESIFLFYYIDFIRRLEKSFDLCRVEYLISIAKIVDILSDKEKKLLIKKRIDADNYEFDQLDYIKELILDSKVEKPSSALNIWAEDWAKNIVTLIKKEDPFTAQLSPIKDWWEKAKELDEKKFVYPFRIGLAFNDKKYCNSWEEIIKIEFGIDPTSEKEYELYQDEKIKSHFQKEAETSKDNKES